MDTQEKFQSQGSGNAGAENTISPAEVDRILAGLESFYTVEAYRAAEAALETVGRMLSTGSIAPDDVSALTNLEEHLDEGLDRIEEIGEGLSALRSRL